MGAPSNLDLLELQLETMYRIDVRGRLSGRNQTGVDPPPRLFLGRTTAGNRWLVRDDQPQSVVDELTRVLEREPVPEKLGDPPLGQERLREILERDAPITREYRGPAFWFPGELPPAPGVELVPPRRVELLRPSFPGWADDIEAAQPCAAIVRDGVAVAVCASATLPRRAAEAGVDTLEAHRGRGYARRVVVAWATAIRRAGLIPLYSTSWDNVASRGVARRLGLVPYAEDFHLT